MPFPPPIEVARQHESLLTDEIREVAFETRDWRLGVMGRTEPGVWMNSAYLDFRCEAERVTPDAIEEMASFYEERGIEPRVELASYTPDETVRAIEAAGFRFGGFEHVLAAVPSKTASIEPPTGIELEWLDTDDAAAVERVVATAHTAFTGEPEPTEGHREVSTRLVKASATACLLAKRGREIVGVSLLEVRGGVACLAFGATLEAHRRFGAQRAMMLGRLRRAAELGCDVATVGGRPGEGTERNAVRLGFAPCFTRLSFTRPAKGLIASQ
mgnify:CR=1 FL=1